MNEERECCDCGLILPVADDQTDWPPEANEVILDAAHKSPDATHHDEYVCGTCLGLYN
jgi:hypothetical protein